MSKVTELFRAYMQVVLFDSTVVLSQAIRHCRIPSLRGRVERLPEVWRRKDKSRGRLAQVRHHAASERLGRHCAASGGICKRHRVAGLHPPRSHVEDMAESGRVVEGVG